MSVSAVPGFSILTSAFNSVTVPGFDVLQPASYFPGAAALMAPSSTTPASAPASNSGSKNSYQTAYTSLETWSSGFLMQSLTNAAPLTQPQYAPGSSASLFAQLQNTLAAIQPGIAAGLYGGGTGFNILA
ncbi:MAG TPA: hypothetical protein VNF68_06515 [Candidatus Baltobacteraceae bacterium]|nr:hypothetical protein [Candidatus Baltobacteraceae bacterium]